MSEYDEFDYYAFRGVGRAAQRCRVCGTPIHESIQRHPMFWIHEIEPSDGHEALPIPKPQFELMLENGKKVVWSGENAEAAIYSYTTYRRRAKVVSWRSVKTTYGPHQDASERPWVPRKRPPGPSV